MITVEKFKGDSVWYMTREDYWDDSKILCIAASKEDMMQLRDELLRLLPLENTPESTLAPLFAVGAVEVFDTEGEAIARAKKLAIERSKSPHCYPELVNVFKRVTSVRADVKTSYEIVVER